MEGVSRSKNFTSDEINKLLSLVKSSAHIIESKPLDGRTREEKEKAWMNIEKQFNSAMNPDGTPFRSAKILKKKYCNFKSEMKKRSAKQYKELFGDIEPKINVRNDLVKMVTRNQVIAADVDMSIVKTEDETQEASLYREEVEFAKPPSKKALSIITEGSANDEGSIDDLETLDFLDTYSTQSKKLKGNSEKAKWAEKKLKQDVKLAKDEHELKIKQMEEMHAMQKRFLHEKHQLEMQILKKRLQEYP